MKTTKNMKEIQNYRVSQKNNNNFFDFGPFLVFWTRSKVVQKGPSLFNTLACFFFTGQGEYPVKNSKGNLSLVSLAFTQFSPVHRLAVFCPR